jgi:ABC-type transport system substrate-binding protein
LSSYVNASIDTILENARQTAHPAERAAAYREFQVTYAQLVPAVLLYTPSYQFVARSNVRGMSPGLLFAPSSRFRDVGGWYVETTRD